jgi:hypothetical protein
MGVSFVLVRDAIVLVHCDFLALLWRQRSLLDSFPSSECSPLLASQDALVGSWRDLYFVSRLLCARCDDMFFRARSTVNETLLCKTTSSTSARGTRIHAQQRGMNIKNKSVRFLCSTMRKRPLEPYAGKAQSSIAKKAKVETKSEFKVEAAAAGAYGPDNPSCNTTEQLGHERLTYAPGSPSYDPSEWLGSQSPSYDPTEHYVSSRAHETPKPQVIKVVYDLNSCVLSPPPDVWLSDGSVGSTSQQYDLAKFYVDHGGDNEEQIREYVESKLSVDVASRFFCFWRDPFSKQSGTFAGSLKDMKDLCPGLYSRDQDSKQRLVMRTSNSCGISLSRFTYNALYMTREVALAFSIRLLEAVGQLSKLHILYPDLHTGQVVVMSAELALILRLQDAGTNVRGSILRDAHDLQVRIIDFERALVLSDTDPSQDNYYRTVRLLDSVVPMLLTHAESNGDDAQWFRTSVRILLEEAEDVPSAVSALLKLQSSLEEQGEIDASTPTPSRH